ncbi:hypothetical protein GE09DRAFT_1095645 [Coniochaeta sp. 2T2.1]|nr:hypothetical protein GE09DRAFT_1095645 [Coniochaeta sp. 2T2.1]
MMTVFRYPYGDDHSWNSQRNEQIILANKDPLALPPPKTAVVQTTNGSGSLANVHLSVGKVFATAPTHVFANNFAERTYSIAARDVDRANGKGSHGPTYQRPFVVRVFKESREVKAFKNVLKSGKADDSAAPKARWAPVTQWMYGLTATNPPVSGRQYPLLIFHEIGLSFVPWRGRPPDSRR